MQASRKSKSGRVLHIRTETIDTGERKQIFGYSARHVITRGITEIWEAGKQLPPSKAETDGWYIDPPAAWLRLHPPTASGYRYFITTSGLSDEVKFVETGEPETGFPLLTILTHRTTIKTQDGQYITHTSVHRKEVTEFSEDPLDASLFLPTQGFRRVIQLPGDHPLSFGFRSRLRWEMCKDALGSVPLKFRLAG